MRSLHLAMGFIPLRLLLSCLLLVALTPIPLGVPGEEAGEKSAELDREISELERKRTADILFSLELLAHKKDYARAAALASRALIVPPSESELPKLTELIEEAAFGLLRVASSPRKTAELCQDAADKLGEDAILFYIASLAYGELGDETRREESQKKARELRPDDQAYWFDVGSFFAKRGELKTALEGYRAAAAISSDKPTHYNADSEASLASIYCRLGDYDEALRHCQNLRDIARKIVVSRTDMAALTAMVHAERGREKEIEGNYEEAIEDYKKSAELSPSPGTAYYSVGEQYLKMGDHAEAEKWFNRALVAGAVPFAHAGLGDVQEARGNPEEAEEEYLKCERALAELIERNPNDAANYNNLAWLYATRGEQLDRRGKDNVRFLKGIDLAKEALKLLPDFPEYLDTLAELHYRLGNRKAAIREIEKAIALDPPHRKYYQKQLEKFRKEE